ncbi:MAG: hypothetical protein WBM24_24480 [Candidatus Sulfotelmatobacter sp.]
MMSDLISETAKPVLETAPGKSLIEEVTRLKTAIQLMVELQGELLKKLQQQDVKLTAIARFVASQSAEKPSFEVL